MKDRTRNTKKPTNKPLATKDLFEFQPHDIILKDDAYHGSKGLQFTEWWYFDAALNDEYSIQFSARILSGLKLSFLFIRFDVYKEGHLIVHKRKIHLLKDVEISKEKPLIKTAQHTKMIGYLDEKTGNLTYDISFQMDEVAAELRFIGITKGWKGKHEADDWWVVSLPRAKVTGTITLHQKTLTVQGSGYHDHNWNVKIFALKKIQPLLVINTIDNGYINIPPRNLHLTDSNVYEENKKMIPHEFNLDAQTDTVSLHVTMKSIDTHHSKIFPLMDYWRYHVKCTGSITIDSKTESIDNLYIAEFLKFR
jgi:hypothetical protein